MEDKQIIALYWSRNEEAIRQTENRYGGKLNALAYRIVNTREDAQECVSDTYLAAWDSMPPQWPEYLFAYLAKICRNLSLSRLDWLNAAKRKAEVVTLTREMELCIPDRGNERNLEGKELGELLNRFLGTISRENRMIFLRRYWYADSIEEIAKRYHFSQSKVKTSLHRTRNKLSVFLAKEGISL
ncbi:MAG: sigma-70 family RNA polymerase sigma factor [Ruminococcaceae bacterium]|nr:sigma-70 family RNA polymerase sigma factor [Oscillospiraceae bacterium]